MLIYVLTGTIASGKSTVANIFRQNSVPVFCSDRFVHELYQQSHAVEYIRSLCPQAAKDGFVDRKILAKYFFQDNELRRKIEDFVYSQLRKMRNDFLQKSAQKKEKMVVLDVPLYFEKMPQMECKIDKTMVVVADEAKIRQRALQRQNMTLEKLNNILKLQLSSEEKAKIADIVIDNNGDFAHLQQQVEDVIKRALGDE